MVCQGIRGRFLIGRTLPLSSSTPLSRGHSPSLLVSSLRGLVFFELKLGEAKAGGGCRVREATEGSLLSDNLPPKRLPIPDAPGVPSFWNEPLLSLGFKSQHFLPLLFPSHSPALPSLYTVRRSPVTAEDFLT